MLERGVLRQHGTHLSVWATCSEDALGATGAVPAGTVHTAAGLTALAQRMTERNEAI